jgi:hypothetical protein
VDGRKKLVAYGTEEGGYSLEYRSEQRRLESGLLREEPEREGANQSLPIEEARRLAHAILRLDGLTGAEIEAAERVLSVDRADIRRLREIAGNHAMLTSEFFSLNESRHIGQENGSQGIGR